MFPYDMYCNTIAVLKVDSIHKQGKNNHPQVYFEEWKCTDAESLQCNMVSDSDDDERFLEVPWTYSNLKRQFFVT